MLATYNGENFLREQLDSICNQTLSKDILLYIGDDGSNDSTLSIIDEYKSKINILERSEKRHFGPALNFWNLLLTAPEADFYAFCDQDDIWDSDKLETALSAIKNYTEPVLYYSNYRIINSSSKITNSDGYKNSISKNIIEYMVCPIDFIGCTALFNNKTIEILRKLKLTQVPMHDFAVSAVMLVMGKIIYDEIPRMSYRHHENNVAARSKKSFYGKFKSRYKVWFQNKFQTSIFAKDLLCNFENIVDENVRKWLYLLGNYKKNFSYKWQILKMLPEKTYSRSSLMSFKIRLLLGLL